MINMFRSTGLRAGVIKDKYKGCIRAVKTADPIQALFLFSKQRKLFIFFIKRIYVLKDLVRTILYAALGAFFGKHLP